MEPSLFVPIDDAMPVISSVNPISSVNVAVKILDSRAVSPYYGTFNSAGMDLCSIDNAIIHPGETVIIHTGIAMKIPDSLVGLIYARSGLGIKKGIAPANKVGVIDSDYRGEIMVALHNHSNEDYEVNTGDRIAQMVLTPYFKASINIVDELDSTDRGEGGFGSTGK